MYYISKVTIKNVLSFNNFEVDLKLGMNMIVGCNGVGKSNFLKILNAAINKNDIFLNNVMDKNSKIIINFEYDNYEEKYQDNFFVQWICHIKNETCHHNNFEFMKDKNMFKNMFKNMLMVIKKKKYEYIRKDILVDNNNFCYYIHVAGDRLCKKFDPSYSYQVVNKKEKKIDDNNFKHQCIKIIRNDPELENKSLIEMEAKTRIQVGRNFNIQLLKLRESNEIKFFSQLEKRSLKNLFDDYIKITSLIMETNNYRTNIKNEIKLNLNTVDCFLKSNRNCELIKYIRDNKLDDTNDYILDKNLPCNDVKLYTPYLKLRIMFLTDKVNRDIIDNIIENNNYIKLGNKLYESLKYKNDSNNLYKQVNNQFKQIFGKNFEIKINDEIKIEHVKLTLKNHNFPIDYINITKEINQDCDFTFDFDLIDSKTKTVLSDGEKECIFFLTAYLSKDLNILIMDEPFAHLHYQAKFEIMKLLHQDKNVKSQMIMVTHDTEMLTHDNINNIIRLSMNEQNNTKSNTLSCLSKNCKDTKMIFQNPKILFSKKCLLVEGYHDYRFMVEFLKVINNNDYCVIILDGKDSKLHEILEVLDIPYKIILDADKIYEKKDNKLNELSNKGKKFLKYFKKNKLERLNSSFEIPFSNDSINNIMTHIGDINENKNHNHDIKKLYNLLDDKLFIWDKYIQDLEGLARQIMPQNFKIKNYNNKDIQNVLINNIQGLKAIICNRDETDENIQCHLNNSNINQNNNDNDNLKKCETILNKCNINFFQNLEENDEFLVCQYNQDLNKKHDNYDDFKNYIINLLGIFNNGNDDSENGDNSLLTREKKKELSKLDNCLKECNMRIVKIAILHNENDNDDNNNNDEYINDDDDNENDNGDNNNDEYINDDDDNEINIPVRKYDYLSGKSKTLFWHLKNRSLCIEVYENDQKFIIFDENNFKFWIKKKRLENIGVVKCNNFGKKEIWNKIYSCNINEQIIKKSKNKYIILLKNFIESDNIS